MALTRPQMNRPVTFGGGGGLTASPVPGGGLTAATQPGQQSFDFAQFLKPRKLKLRQPDGTVVEMETDDPAQTMMDLYQRAAGSTPPDPKIGEAEIEGRRREALLKVLEQYGAPTQRGEFEAPAMPTRADIPLPREERPNVGIAAQLAGILGGFVAPEQAGNIAATQMQAAMASQQADMERRNQIAAQAITKAGQQYEDSLTGRNEEIRWRLLNEQRRFDDSEATRKYRLMLGQEGVEAKIPAQVGAKLTERDVLLKKHAGDVAAAEGFEAGTKLGIEDMNARGNYAQSMTGASLNASRQQTEDAVRPHVVKGEEAKTVGIVAQTDLTRAETDYRKQQAANAKQERAFNAQLQGGRITLQGLEASVLRARAAEARAGAAYHAGRLRLDQQLARSQDINAARQTATDAFLPIKQLFEGARERFMAADKALRAYDAKTGTRGFKRDSATVFTLKRAYKAASEDYNRWSQVYEQAAAELDGRLGSINAQSRVPWSVTDGGSRGGGSAKPKPGDLGGGIRLVK